MFAGTTGRACCGLGLLAVLAVAESDTVEPEPVAAAT